VQQPAGGEFIFLIGKEMTERLITGVHEDGANDIPAILGGRDGSRPSESALVVVPSRTEVVPANEEMAEGQSTESSVSEIEVTVDHEHHEARGPIARTRNKYRLRVYLGPTLRWSILAMVASVALWKLKDIVVGLHRLMAAVATTAGTY
jgi:hypothetical protein